MATPPGEADVVVWVKRGPHPSPEAKQGIVPFEAVEHQGWVCLLYTHFASLSLDTFRVAGDRKVERMRNGLAIVPFAPEDKAVGFRREGTKLKVVFTRSTTEYPNQYYWLFSIEESRPKWLQLPSKAVPGSR